MTKRTTTEWDPEQDLTALLDGLTDELLTAFDHEVSAHLPETASEQHDSAEAMRRLVAAADADFVVLPVSSFITPGLRAYIVRNQ